MFVLPPRFEVLFKLAMLGAALSTLATVWPTSFLDVLARY
jgi:hypothetical protein